MERLMLALIGIAIILGMVVLLAPPRHEAPPPSSTQSVSGPRAQLPPSGSTPSGSPASFEIFRVEPVAECITLRNAGGETADLGGWTISDGEGNYTFPRGVTVAPGGTHRVCMDTYNPTAYTRGLYLNNDSDCVLLFPPECWEAADSYCW